MPKAIKPSETPKLPEGMTGWARSTKRAGGVYHAHVLGMTACGSIRLDRHSSDGPRHLFDFQYWGVCPRCFAKGEAK